jgi:hypothetical protein
VLSERPSRVRAEGQPRAGEGAAPACSRNSAQWAQRQVVGESRSQPRGRKPAWRPTSETVAPHLQVYTAQSCVYGESGEL